MKKLIIPLLLLNLVYAQGSISFNKGGIEFDRKIKIESKNKLENVSNKSIKNTKLNGKEKIININDKNIIDKKIKLLLKTKKLLGKKYVYGAKVGDKNNFDCSSFTKEVYKTVGVNLPRVSRQQSKIGKGVSINNLKIGDLIFFNTLGNYVSHVGLSLGGNKFVHASSKAGKIIVSDLKGYYLDKATKYKRIF